GESVQLKFKPLEYFHPTAYAPRKLSDCASTNYPCYSHFYASVLHTVHASCLTVVLRNLPFNKGVVMTRKGCKGDLLPAGFVQQRNETGPMNENRPAKERNDVSTEPQAG